MGLWGYGGYQEHIECDWFYDLIDAGNTIPRKQDAEDDWEHHEGDWFYDLIDAGNTILRKQDWVLWCASIFMELFYNVNDMNRCLLMRVYVYDVW